MAADKLATYQATRDFTQTAEPSGAAAVQPSERLRFIIQRHAATRFHYDLRLALDGVFKSWAVTRGPPLDPHDKRLAVETEDHPLDYGDFEGTIPKGQYGGGTVQLWDRGTWAPQGMTAEQGLEKGDLKFTMEGGRLHGSWVLVRIKGWSGKRVNWLLIKHRDEHAKEGDADALLADDRSIASGRPMADIAAGSGRAPKPFMLAGADAVAKDAVWDSSVGLVPALRAEKRTTKPRTRATPKPDLAAMPDFIEPQLCHSVERPPSGEGSLHEIKFDGYRVQVRVEGGRAVVRTRKGLDWTARFPGVARACAALLDGIVDGEIVALDADGAPDFAALQASLAEGTTEQLVLFAFDLLHAGAEDLRPLKLSERKARLRAFLTGKPAPDPAIVRFVDQIDTGGDAILRSACRLSLEGIVSKQANAPYRSGRSETWTKAKCRAGHEMVIGAWADTAGQLRSLIVGVYRGDHFIHVGRVGTGFGRDVAARLLPRLESRRRPQEPVHRSRRATASREHPLGASGTGRRGGVRRMDGRGPGPAGLVQGLAGGQARRGGSSRDARTGGKNDHRNAECQAFDREGRRRDGDGRVDIAAGQGHVAGGGGRGRPAGDQARPRALLRGGRTVAAAAPQGPPLLHHPGAGRLRGRDLLPAPRDAGLVEPAGARHRLRRPEAIPRDRPRGGAGRGCADSGARAASVELRSVPPGRARPAGVRPRPRSRRGVHDRHRGGARCATDWPGWASSASARRQAARACTS